MAQKRENSLMQTSHGRGMTPNSQWRIGQNVRETSHYIAELANR